MFALAISIVITTCVSVSYASKSVELDVIRDVYRSCCREVGSCGDWKRLDNNNTADVCSFSSIDCNPDGLIIAINASGFGLSCDSQIQQLQLLDHLERLDVSNNRLSGIIPHYLSDSLTELYADNNMLIGSIPISYATHPSLVKLSALNNQLTELPIEWTSLVYQEGDPSFPLRYINVADNNIHGSFPQGLAYYPLLEVVDLSNNQLTGNIGPKGNVDAFQSLKSLKVSNNMLEGALPQWTQYVPDLQTPGNNLGPQDTSTSSGLSGGAIAGIVIGTLVAVVVLIGATVFLWRRHRNDSFERFRDNPIVPPPNVM